MNLDSFSTGLVGAVIGGALTGLFSLLAVFMAENYDRDKRAENDARTLKGLLQALHDELESVYERYEETAGGRLEALADGQPLLMYYPVVENFFTVYSANAFLVGRIEDNDLRKSLVHTYVLAKGLVDSFRMNNELVFKYEDWTILAAQTNSELHRQHAANLHNGLVAYARGLKASHAEVKKAISELLRKLRKLGVLHEAG